MALAVVAVDIFVVVGLRDLHQPVAVRVDHLADGGCGLAPAFEIEQGFGLQHQRRIACGVSRLGDAFGQQGGRIGGFPGDEFPNVAFGRARLVEVVHVVLVEEGHGAVVTGQIRVAESPQEACFAAQMVVFELRELRIADLREDLVREADRPVETAHVLVREGHSARGEARGVGGGVVSPSVAVVGQTFAQHREIAPESHLAAQLIIDRVDDALHLCRIGHEGRGVYLFGMFFEELPFFARRKRRCDTGGGQQCEYDVFHGLRRLGR